MVTPAMTITSVANGGHLQSRIQNCWQGLDICILNLIAPPCSTTCSAAVLYRPEQRTPRFLVELSTAIFQGIFTLPCRHVIFPILTHFVVFDRPPSWFCIFIPFSFPNVTRTKFHVIWWVPGCPLHQPYLFGGCHARYFTGSRRSFHCHGKLLAVRCVNLG